MVNPVTDKALRKLEKELYEIRIKDLEKSLHEYQEELKKVCLEREELRDKLDDFIAWEDPRGGTKGK